MVRGRFDSACRRVRAEGSHSSCGPAPHRHVPLAAVTGRQVVGERARPVHDLAATLVHSARSFDVRTPIVDGRALMRDRALLTIDVPEVVRELGRRRPALLDRSHGGRIQECDT